MSKPDDIPKDVMKSAANVVVSLGIGGTTNPNPDGFAVRDAVARAILAERRRCAALLNEGCTLQDGQPVDPAVPEIYHAINEGFRPIDCAIRHPQETTNG